MTQSLIIGKSPQKADGGTPQPPPILLALYLALIPIAIGDRANQGPNIALADIVMAVLALSMLKSGLRLRSREWSLWQFIVLLVLVGGVWNASQSESLVTAYAVVQKLAGYIVYLATYYVIVTTVRQRAATTWIMKCYSASVAAHSAIAVVVYIAQRRGLVDANFYNEGDRLSGLMHDPNAFGGVIAIASIFHIAIRLARAYNGDTRISRLGLRVADLVLPLGLFLTYSRTAWLAWAIGLGLLALSSLHASRQVFRLAILGAIGVVLLLSTHYGETIRDLARRDSTLTSRLDITRSAVAFYSERPVLGRGLGVFVHEYGAIVHNTGLWFAAEMGTIGVVAFGGYCVSYTLRGLRIRSRLREVRQIGTGLLCAHISMVALSLGLEAFYQRQWWLTVALLGALSSVRPTTAADDALAAERLNGRTPIGW